MAVGVRPCLALAVVLGSLFTGGRAAAADGVVVAAAAVQAAPVAAAPAPAAPAFEPAASGFTWDGQTVTVRFREIGLEPGSTTTIAVEATATLEVTCRQAGTVLLTIRASSSAADVSQYQADALGTVTGSRQLGLALQSPTVVGLPCAIEEVRTVTVTLRDLETGAVLVLS